MFLKHCKFGWLLLPFIRILLTEPETWRSKPIILISCRQLVYEFLILLIIHEIIFSWPWWVDDRPHHRFDHVPLLSWVERLGSLILSWHTRYLSIEVCRTNNKMTPSSVNLTLTSLTHGSASTIVSGVDDDNVLGLLIFLLSRQQVLEHAYIGVRTTQRSLIHERRAAEAVGRFHIYLMLVVHIILSWARLRTSLLIKPLSITHEHTTQLWLGVLLRQCIWSIFHLDTQFLTLLK